MVVEQMDLFKRDYFILDKNKQIRLIELFAGYGSQNTSLEYLGFNTHYKIVEWAVKSIQAYNDLHIQDYTDYSTDLTREEVENYLFEKGISNNYNEPMTLKQIKRKGEKWQRQVYSNIIATNNLVNIQQVKGKDLEIIDKDEYQYIMTYSFPCLTADMLILTERGYIPIIDVKVGDKVLTKSNTWQKVAKKFDNGIHNTCYINGMGFENIHCTLNHKFYTREKYYEWDSVLKRNIRKFKKPEFVEAKDITKNHYLGIPIVQEEEPFYTNNLNFWHMLGMYLGDGWLSKKGYDVKFGVNDKKTKLLIKDLEALGLTYSVYQEKSCNKVRFANKDIHNFIKSNLSTGSSNKFISNEVICLPKEELNAFLQGYLDTDGCEIDKLFKLTTVNKGLSYSISAIINKVYRVPTRIYKHKTKDITTIEGRVVNQKDFYQIVFKKDCRKQDKAFCEGNYIWFPFSERIEAKEEHVYNMEIENDHSYIVQGVISKNCQDLSLAGNQKGMADTSTRSGMLWEVERILKELKPLNQLPQMLLMENVPQVHGEKNMAHFNKWLNSLKELGYNNFWQDSNAKDYGIPQNRKRTFMVSVLGNFDYQFPKPIKLEKKLSDLLENEVDEKYYLSKEVLNRLEKSNYQSARPTNKLKKTDTGISPTLDTMQGGYRQPFVRIKNTTKKGYLEATVGDGVDLAYPDSKTRRGRVQKGLSQTITTSDNLGVVAQTGAEQGSDEGLRFFKDNCIGTLRTIDSCGDKRVIEQTIKKINESNRYSEYSKKKIVENLKKTSNEISGTITANCMQSFNHDNCQFVFSDSKEINLNISAKEPTERFSKQAIETFNNNKCEPYDTLNAYNKTVNKSGITATITTRPDGFKTAILPITSDLRIRKITPKECFRLMGLKDEDIVKISKNKSDSNLYHLAGDSIVVPVLMAIFGSLLGIDYETKIKWLKR